MSPERLQACFIEACVADVQALKPGNVRERSPTRGVTAEDFVRSAEACAAALCARDVSLGERIANAIEARRRVVKTNTNLGIVLLCAPLIQCVVDGAASEVAGVANESTGGAASDAAASETASEVKANETANRQASGAASRRTDVAGGASAAKWSAATLRARLKETLAQTTVADARAAYRAIRRAGAGGLGRVGEQDLAQEPGVSLRDAMALAAERDTIAAEYAGNYERIFGTALPYYLALRARWGYNERAVTGLYLFILGTYPDTLVARKFGRHKANTLSRMFRSIAGQFAEENSAEMQDYLANCDAMLKARGMNPGTTADITVASIFLAKILD